MENEKVEEQEQGMSFSDILFLLKKNILLIVIITVLFTIFGVVYGFKIKSPSYTGTVTAIVMADGTPGGGNNTADYVYAEYYTGVFKSLIESNPVMNAAKDKLDKQYDIQMTRDDLASCITVSTQDNSLIITVSAKVHSKDDKEGRHEAQVIANTVIESAIQEANKPALDEDGNPIYETEKINGVEHTKQKYVYGVYANKLVVMESVEDPEDVVYKRGAGTTIIITFLIGLIVSFGVILIKYLADDTFTSKDVFEKKFNIQVLSVIEEIKTPEENKNTEGGNK